MATILGHTRVSAPEHPDHWLYLLHGIYGSGRNWGSVARRLTEKRPEWGVILVDLRLHGGSTGFAPPHTLEACADDLALLQSELSLPASTLLGHSFGGKVAILGAGCDPAGLAQVWAVDTTLRVGRPVGTAWDVVEIVKTLPDRFGSRQELVEAFVRHGYAAEVGHWLAMNLARADGSFTWKLDWAGVEEMLRDFFATDVWPVLEALPEPIELHVVKASASSAVDGAALERLRRLDDGSGRVHLHEVEGGHWVNVDNPDAVLDLLAEHLPRS